MVNLKEFQLGSSGWNGLNILCQQHVKYHWTVDKPVDITIMLVRSTQLMIT